MIGFDKVLHFVFSLRIGLFSPVVAVWAGWAKELYDAATGSFIDPADLCADWLGIYAAVLLSPFW